MEPKMTKAICVAGRNFSIAGDDSYTLDMSADFDPELVALMAVLCDDGAHVLDVGGNIGLTALALSQICGSGKVVAVEPVPRTFDFLSKNVAHAANVTTKNFALGKVEGTLPMQGANDNLSGSFIADEFHIADAGHFTVDVPVKTIDGSFSSFELDRIDFMKIDVEGFELEVFEGGIETLRRDKPRVVLEMNHWCLNMFRRISIPEFRERLLAIFPYVYAVQGSKFLDFSDPDTAYQISHAHIVHMEYANVVAGFDKGDLIARLSRLGATRFSMDAASRASAEHQQILLDNQRLRQAYADELQQKEAISRHRTEMLNSSSWRLTSPVRALKKLFS
jgi:FkbM family methyltransferase